MTFPFVSPARAAVASAALLCTFALAGCGGNPAGSVLASTGLGPKTAATPDFVASTRPQKLDYIPIGTPQEGRPTAAKTPDEVKAAEAELDALRAQNQAKGEAAAALGGTPAPEPVMLPADTSAGKSSAAKTSASAAASSKTKATRKKQTR